MAVYCKCAMLIKAIFIKGMNEQHIPPRITLLRAGKSIQIVAFLPHPLPSSEKVQDQLMMSHAEL